MKLDSQNIAYLSEKERSSRTIPTVLYSAQNPLKVFCLKINFFFWLKNMNLSSTDIYPMAINHGTTKLTKWLKPAKRRFYANISTICMHYGLGGMCVVSIHIVERDIVNGWNIKIMFGKRISPYNTHTHSAGLLQCCRYTLFISN